MYKSCRKWHKSQSFLASPRKRGGGTADNFFWLAVQYSDSPAFTILKLFRAVTVGIGNNPSGSRPILLGDSTSPLTREARTWCGARDSAGLGGLVRIGNNPSGSRPNFFGRQHLTFDKGGKNMVRG